MNRDQIERYAAGAIELSRALEGLTRDDLLAHPVPGTWSIQQIALHLMDSDLVASDRMKRVVAEENPLLLGYDESLFATRLGYEQLDARQAAEVFRLNRLLTAEMLRHQPDEAFSRRGVHRDGGKEKSVTLEYLVGTYIDHLDGHLVFVRTKRDLLGKPLPLPRGN